MKHKLTPYVLVSPKTAKAEQITLPPNIPGIYAIRHIPSGATYIGKTTSFRVAHRAWHYRLAHIHTTPVLNWAFKAIYTKRSDFRFVTLVELDAVSYAIHGQNVESDWKQTIFKKGPEFVLNSDNSAGTRAFWLNRTPKEERGDRFTAAFNSKPTKVKLVPGKLRTNMGLGNDLARVKYVEYLRGQYKQAYDTLALLTNEQIWDCALATEDIEHLVIREKSTIKLMREKVLAAPGGDVVSEPITPNTPVNDTLETETPTERELTEELKELI